MELNLSQEELDRTFSNDNEAILRLDGEYFIEANKKALSLLGLSSLEVFKSLHPAMISPEYQKDGELSKLKANRCFSLLPEHKSMRFIWQHINLHKELFEVTVTLKIIELHNKTFIDVHWKEL